MVEQLSEVDADTAKNLTDSVLGAMNPDSDSSVVSGIEDAVESQTADIVPPVIPAIADLLDEDMKQDPILEGTNVEGALNNVIHQGNSIIDQITNGNDANADPELRSLLEEVSGIVDTAEGQLQSPVCVISSAINGVATQVVVPCDNAGADATTTVIQLAPSVYSIPPSMDSVASLQPVAEPDATQTEPAQAPPQVPSQAPPQAPQEKSSMTSQPVEEVSPPSDSSSSSNGVDQDIAELPPAQVSSPALPMPNLPRPHLEETHAQPSLTQKTSPPPPAQETVLPPPNQDSVPSSEVQPAPQPWPTAVQSSDPGTTFSGGSAKGWPIQSDSPAEVLSNPVLPTNNGQPPSSASSIFSAVQPSVVPTDSPNTNGGTSGTATVAPQWSIPVDAASQNTGVPQGLSQIQTYS
jgi:hypothetical protein